MTLGGRGGVGWDAGGVGSAAVFREEGGRDGDEGNYYQGTQLHLEIVDVISICHLLQC